MTGAEKDAAEVFGDLLAQELGDSTPMTDDAWASSLYLDVATPQDVEKFLNDSGEYENGRWARLPESPTVASELKEPLCKLINRILERLLPSDAKASRLAVDAHANDFKAEAVNGTRHRASPNIVVKASGPSFSLPRGSSLGFSNIATCFDTKLDIQAEDYSHNLAYLTAYAKYMFIQQPNRFFARSLVITEKRANLFHFDRSGAQYSPLFNIHDEPRMFVRLILGLCAVDERMLGLDNTIQWSVGEDGRKSHGTLTTSTCDGATIIYDLATSQGPFVRSNLRGRGTTCWTVKNSKGERLIVKDYWISEGRMAEFELLNEAKGLPGVCQMVSHQDRCVQTKDFRRNSKEGAFHNRIATRIVMKAYGRPIENFSSAEQVLAALRDAIAGHKALLSRNIIHRDVSPNNILLGLPGSDQGDQGVLIDLDIAIRCGDLTQADYKIGTRLFQSLMVLCTFQLSATDVPAHDYLDDLESFFWVFAYLLCVYKADGKPAPRSRLHDHVRSWQNPNPFQAHAAKLCFISAFIVDPDIEQHLDEGWRVACGDMFLKFRAYMRKLAKEKENLVCSLMGCEVDGALPNRFSSILHKVDEHYDHILGLFDDALKKIRDAAKETSPSASSPQRDIPSGIPAPVVEPIRSSVSPDIALPDISSSSISDKLTPVLSSTPFHGLPLTPPSTTSQSSKRRSEEAELDDTPITSTKRICPPSRRPLRAVVGPPLHVFNSLYEYCRSWF